MDRRGDRKPPRGAGSRAGALTGKVAVAMLAVMVLAATGYGWSVYHGLVAGMRTSQALAGEAGSSGADTNILIMGLDSRLDENGNPLPQNIYDALHAGDQQDGGYNANVLMLLHIPGDGSRATSISIPRDDYVALPGCPDHQCQGKIKQAYGLAFDAEHRQLSAQGQTDRAALEQQSREAGRRAEIDTVRQFLGGAPVDHFVEVTLVAFFQIAQVVQPVTVCVNEDTQDSYSGANFHKGQQAISAEQAVAFVRQRRDYVHPALNFTDLDRERRQQAFISALAYQLKQGGAFANPAKLQSILDVARQNTAIDAGLNLLDLAQQASNLTGGNISFVTLPIDHFGKDPAGEDVNIVNLAQVRAIASQLLGTGPSPASTTPTATTSSAPTTPSTPASAVEVVNASGRDGLAAQVESFASAHGYRAGATSTDQRHLTRSAVYYSAGARSTGSALARLLGVTTVQQDGNVPTGHVRVVLGTDFSMPAQDSAATVATTSPPPTAPPGDTATLDSLGGGGIPCVK